MAVDLNKSRMLESRLAVFLAVVTIFLARPILSEEGMLHEMLQHAGLLLIGICVIGRVYASAFLGGHKNQKLIDLGPYSVVRNPLYFFSLCGVTGIALMTGFFTIMIGLPVFFLLLYKRLIRREEQFLLEKFGRPYHDYCQAVPKLWPNLRLYNVPEAVEVNPKYLLFAAYDAFWWFLSLPVIELIEKLRTSGLLKPIIMIP